MDNVKLTPEQIEHWRRVLISIVGPYGLIMKPEQIQKYRDVMQERINNVGGTNG